ncbi:MAG TPA: hypothetical protein PLD47_04375 [Aggregatilineales bacterium]|nr:hypothetical protein [Anaerolineales bacterium]HRE46938.1 hypothetical protein [Aggregatilineales bacterium]
MSQVTIQRLVRGGLMGAGVLMVGLAVIAVIQGEIDPPALIFIGIWVAWVVYMVLRSDLLTKRPPEHTADDETAENG